MERKEDPGGVLVERKLVISEKERLGRKWEKVRFWYMVLYPTP